MRYHNVKGNMTSSSEATDLDDKFDVLMDANDHILEKVVSKKTHILQLVVCKKTKVLLDLCLIFLPLKNALYFQCDLIKL